MLAHLRGPAADDNDAEAPSRKSQAGARPLTHSHSSAAGIKDLPVEGWTGQTDLAGFMWIYPKECFLLPEKECYWCNRDVCVHLCLCESECVCSSCCLRHIRSSWTPPSSFKDTPPSCTSPSLSLPLSLSHTSHTRSHFLCLTLCDRPRCWRRLLTFWTVKGLRWNMCVCERVFYRQAEKPHTSSLAVDTHRISKSNTGAGPLLSLYRLLSVSVWPFAKAERLW